MGNANTITIRVSADGSAAIVGMKQTVDGVERETSRAGKSIDLLDRKFQMLAIPAAAIFSVYQLGTAVTSMVGSSIKYLGTLETANLGIAAAFMTSGHYIDQTTGKALQGEAALRAAQVDAKQIMQELQVANMQTIATLDELVQAYQVTLPVAMAKGFNKEQVKAYTVAMVQAAGAIGLPMNQLGEETRSMLTGNIDPRNSRIATVLGLRNEDIKKHMQNADDLFAYLMGKLDAYKVAGVESQKTWAGITSNAKDIALQMGGQALQPLFEAVKYELTQVTAGLVTVDEKTKTITWNQGFLDQIDSIKSGITATIAEVYRLSMLLDKAGGTWTSMNMIAGSAGSALGISRKKHPILASMLGSTEEFEEYARKNLEYEQRYLNNDRKLQALAYRMAGLDENGNAPGKSGASPYQQNSPGQDEKEREKQARAAEKARRDRETVSLTLAAIRDRDLQIGKEKDERELIQLDQKHRQELKSLRDHHATKRQLMEAQNAQERERTDLMAQQQLEKSRAMALAEVQIIERKVEEQAAWQEKLDAYQSKTGQLSEADALARRYQRERQIMAAKQDTLSVQIAQEKSDAKRLELEAQYWALQQQIDNSATAEGNDRNLALRATADAYAEINIRLKEMAGLLVEAEQARQQLFWSGPKGQQLINDAMAGKPGAADAYWSQEHTDQLNLQNARLDDPVNGRNGLRNQLRMAGMERQDPYAAQQMQLQQAYQDQLRLADNYYAEKVGKEQEHAALIEQIQQEHAAKMKQVETDRWKSAAGTVSGYMGQMAQELMQGNKRQFEIGKRMAQATAAIQGALAIIQCYGQLGPIAGTVAAVVIGAATLQSIAKIDSQQYVATRVAGGSVEAGRAYMVGEQGREVFTPDQNGTITPNNRLGSRNQPIQVTMVNQISTGVQATVRAEIMGMQAQLEQLAVAAVGRAIRMGEFQEVA
jgi:hypothetical protein